MATPDQRARGKAQRNANATAAVILCAAACLAWFAHVEYAERARAHLLTEFGSLTATRHARLKLRVQTRRQLLDAVVAFIGASPSMDQRRFSRFASSVLQAGHLEAVCWNASDGGTVFFAGMDAAKGEAWCRRFNPVTPSEVVGGPRPYASFGRYAPTEEAKLRGFASVIFAVSDIALEDPAEQLDEYLVLSDSNQNTLQAYELPGAGLASIPHTDSPASQYFEVATFGSATFYYLSRMRQLAPNRLALAFVSTLLILGVVAAVLVRGLLLQKDAIAHEVAARTQELSQFAYRTSHDLRGPLTTISGLCRAAQEDLAEGEHGEVADNLQRIHRSSDKLQTLVGDILDLTKADLAVEASTPLNFEQICQTVFTEMDDTFTGSQVELRSRVLDCPSLAMPRGRVRQILMNLVSNGIKYANHNRGEPAFVAVNIQGKPDGLVIVVEDNGLGIPEDRVDRVFDVFERFHPQLAQPGSGLGMTIVKRHVEWFTGSISLSSNDNGTRVQIFLPHGKEAA